MRIAFVSDSYIPVPTGVAVSIETLRRVLKGLGHSVVVFAPDYPGWSVKEEGVVRLPALFSPFNSTIPARWPAFGINSKKIRSLKIDIVHSHYFFRPFPLAQDIASASACPLIHSFYRIFDRDVTIKYVKSCTGIIALSKASKKILQEMNVPAKIHTLPVGIFTKDYASYPPQAVRKRFRIPEERQLLLYPARLDDEAEFMFLLKSFKKIWQAQDDVHLLVVGGGEKLKYYYELAGKQPFGKYITFTGFLPKKRLNKIYGACDLTIYPKKNDPEPLVLLESMAAGTPVVCVKGMGAQDLMVDHQTGFVTPAKVDQFAEAVIDLLRRDTLRFKFSQHCRQHAKRFSASILTRDLLDFYEQELLSENHKF